MTRAGFLFAAAIALAGGILFSGTVYADALDDAFPARQDRDPESAVDARRPKTLSEWMFGRSSHTNEKEEPEEERLDPDRPHLPEASTTVGKGRIVLESGYTFTEKGSSFSSHAYPEALLRIGMFADWFEFRIGQNFLTQEHTFDGVRKSDNGAQDLYLGVKLALTEQKEYLPQIALIPQLTVPTGSKAVTAGRVLPGLNVDCDWEVIKNRFNLELLVATNRVADDGRRSHVELTTGLTGIFPLTRKLEAFVEWDAFYPVGPTASGTGPRHYAVAGFVYFFTKDFEVDIRAGIGLNGQANDFLAGTGFAVRY